MIRSTSPPMASDLGRSVGVIRRVLVVDDSRLQRKILLSLLKKWGFDVAQAESGEQAIAIAQEFNPDLVLSDWMMPGMSGLDLCEAFRNLPSQRYSYFILLTSKSDTAEIARGLDSGADDFLSKPVDGVELRARIAAGDRLLRMQRELEEKNKLITETLDELQRVYDSLDNDLLEAKKLQQSLLRERHRVLPQGEISLVLRSSGHVGGDLVGFFPAGERYLGLYGIDVSGHGVSSALMTARLAGYLSAAVPEQNVALQRDGDDNIGPRSPDQVIAELNELVLNDMETEHYFTLLLAFIDLETGHIKLSQAGHPHPVVQRADGSIEQTGTGGFPVGLIHDVTFEVLEIILESGDRIAVFSDGVTECPDPSGKMLEEAGLAKMMQDLDDLRGTAFLEMLMWQLADYAGDEGFPDDVSGIVFEYSGDQ